MKFFNSAAPARPVDVVDVTAYAEELDPASYDVIRHARIAMTRAERLVLFSLTFGLRPARYLEIGTLLGGSATIVCAAMDMSDNDGRMVALDPKPQIPPATWDKLKHRTTLITGFSPAALPQAKQAAAGPFDLVLIDGDHEREGVLRDANGVLAVANAGAHLLFHDCHNDIVRSAIDAFVRQHARRLVDVGPLTREITVETTPDGQRLQWGGLRLVQVRQ